MKYEIATCLVEDHSQTTTSSIERSPAVRSEFKHQLTAQLSSGQVGWLPEQLSLFSGLSRHGYAYLCSETLSSRVLAVSPYERMAALTYFKFDLGAVNFKVQSQLLLWSQAGESMPLQLMVFKEDRANSVVRQTSLDFLHSSLDFHQEGLGSGDMRYKGTFQVSYLNGAAFNLAVQFRGHNDYLMPPFDRFQAEGSIGKNTLADLIAGHHQTEDIRQGTLGNWQIMDRVIRFRKPGMPGWFGQLTFPFQGNFKDASDQLIHSSIRQNPILADHKYDQIWKRFSHQNLGLSLALFQQLGEEHEDQDLLRPF